MYRVVYEYHRSNHYLVRWVQKNISIIVSANFLKKLLQVKTNVILGCCYVSESDMIELGFLIVPTYPLNHPAQERIYGRIS